MSIMQTETKAAVLKRLKRIEGQVRGLARMVEEDRYCIDVVTQISAVRAALRRVEEESCATMSRIASSTPSPAATATTSGRSRRAHGCARPGGSLDGRSAGAQD